MSVNTSPQAKTLSILMMPDFRIDNPYQSLLSQALESQGVKVEFPQGYRRVFPIFRAVSGKSQSFKLLHLHWLSPYIKGEKRLTKTLYAVKFLIDIALTRLRGLKIVWTVHNQVSHDAKFPGIELWTRRILAKLVNRVIVHSHFTLAAIARAYQLQPSKIEIIPHGHYREIYSPPVDPEDARKKLDLPLGKRIYLNLGMLKPYKGLEQLITLWQERHLSDQGTLLIAGKPQTEAYGQKLKAQIANSSTIKLYPEFIENDDIHLFFSAADLVVLPFANITTSGSLILAMSYGKAVIAPRLGAIEETVSFADQLLYDPKDEQGLLQAIQRSTHISLKELSHKVESACDLLDWAQISQKTLKTYRAAIENGVGGSDAS